MEGERICEEFCACEEADKSPPAAPAADFLLLPSVARSVAVGTVGTCPSASMPRSQAETEEEERTEDRGVLKGLLLDNITGRRIPRTRNHRDRI